MIAMLGQFRMRNRANQRMCAQKCQHLARVCDVPIHAHWQRLHALQNLPRRHRGHASTEVTQALATAAQQESRGRGLLRKHHVVKALIRRRERREISASLV